MDWGSVISAVAPALIGGAASIFGSKAQGQGYANAADASTYATDRAIQSQREMFDIMRNDTAPLRNLLPGALGQLQAQAGQGGLSVPWNLNGQPMPDMMRVGGGTGVGGGYQPERQYLNSLASISTPSLRNNVDFNLESDPIYQAQMADMSKRLNRNYAARGSMISSDADNALIRNALPFMEQSYGRGVADLDRYNQNALTSYNLDTSKLMNLFGLEGSLGDQRWGRQLDLAKLGAGAAASAGQGAQSTGNALSSIYQNQGQTMAGLASAQGQNKAQMYGNLAAAGQQGYNNYLIGQYLQ